MNTIRRNLMTSNWWPVAAYLTMALWLIMVNINNLPVGYRGSEQYFRTLSQLDGIAHFTVALSLTSVGVSVLGCRRTFGIMMALVLTWEAFEVLTQPLLAGPSLRLDSVYLVDMLDDITIGLAGALIGVYFGAEPSNTPVV